MLVDFFRVNESVLAEDVVNHLANLVSQEWKRPRKEVEASGQVEGLFYVLVLLDVHFVVFNQNDCSFVFVRTTVVGC